MEQAAPWLILAGSGGIADVLAALVSQPHLLVPQVTEKQFREKFPGECFSWEAIVHWTELVRAAGGCCGHVLHLSSQQPLGGMSFLTVLQALPVASLPPHLGIKRILVQQ